jgi:acyl dehydratase
VPAEERAFPAWSYEVGREKIREFADVLGHRDPWFHDRDAARAAGFRDVVAPPMFAVVYCKWMGPVIADPDLGIDYARMLHGAQDLRFGEPVCAGDVVTTAARLRSIHRKKALTFYEIGSISTNQRGELVAEGIWTMIVRGSDG